MEPGSYPGSPASVAPSMASAVYIKISANSISVLSLPIMKSPSSIVTDTSRKRARSPERPTAEVSTAIRGVFVSTNRLHAHTPPSGRATRPRLKRRADEVHGDVMAMVLEGTDVQSFIAYTHRKKDAKRSAIRQATRSPHVTYFLVP
ncbi:choline-sulfatase [Anopheles sinensis]|uniref:Choline-sulfatase n=1 Tax=Anopheles sinensis TaxID=74873 RepID=A0A084VE85_ANOSI|nr:choline-sulfatase [Anopheles sinensis]